MARSSTTFQKGNKVAVGNRGPTRRDPCTRALFSQVFAVDKDTGRETIDVLCATLIQLALGYQYETIKNGVRQKVKVQPNLTAIRAIFDRTDGRVPRGGSESR